jgi:hypothetical protein
MKIYILTCGFLATFFYYFGVALQYTPSRTDTEIAINNIWLCSLFFDLKSGNKIWMEFCRHDDGTKIWQSLKDKDESFFVIEGNYNQ